MVELTGVPLWNICMLLIPLFIKPRKEAVIGVAAQDVQISGSMTGSHVGATPVKGGIKT